MTTVHHPPVKGVDFHHDHNWLWIGLSTVLAVIAVGAIAWAMTSPTVTETASVAPSIGFELSDDTSVARIITPGEGVTTHIYGAIPETVVATGPLAGLELSDDTSVARIITPGEGVTTDIYVVFGEL